MISRPTVLPIVRITDSGHRLGQAFAPAATRTGRAEQHILQAVPASSPRCRTAALRPRAPGALPVSGGAALARARSFS